jgi:hypothetical protein
MEWAIMRYAPIVVLLAAWLLFPGPRVADAQGLIGEAVRTVTSPWRLMSHRGGRRTAHARRHHQRVAHGRHRARVAHGTRSRAPAAAAATAGGAAAGAAANAATEGAATTGVPGPVADRRQAAAAMSAQPGWAGPLYWPYATDDLLGYALQPSNAGIRFWGHGARDLADAMFVRPGTASANWNEMCGAQRPLNAWTDEIAQVVQPNEAQRAKLDDLGAAFEQADKSIRGTCPTAETKGPVQRVDVMRDRLWAMRQAVVLMRPPLEGFYQSLDERQRTLLNDMRATTGSTEPAGATPAQISLHVCADPAAAAVPWPNAQIERRVRPSNEQRQSLQTLQATTQGMGQLLMASCPRQVPATVLERLDAAEKRLDAMLYAARVIEPQLRTVHSALRDDQRTAFDALGQEARGAAPGAPSMAKGER